MAKNKSTHIVVILDRSGSMGTIRNDMIGGLRQVGCLVGICHKATLATPALGVKKITENPQAAIAIIFPQPSRNLLVLAAAEGFKPFLFDFRIHLDLAASRCSSL